MPPLGFRAPRDPAFRRTLAPELAALGFQWMEVGYEVAADAEAEVRDLARRLGLTLSYHCRFVDVNLSSPLAPVRSLAVALVEQDLEQAARLGAAVAVVHGGDIGWFDFLPPDHPDYAENQAVIDRLFPLHRAALAQSLGALAEVARRLGLRLVCENMYMPWEVFRHPDELALLPAGVDLCLDVGHARVAGLNPGAFPARWVGHTHIHWNDGRYDLHHPLTPANAGACAGALAAVARERPQTCLLLELPPRSAAEYRLGWTALQGILSSGRPDQAG